MFRQTCLWARFRMYSIHHTINKCWKFVSTLKLFSNFEWHYMQQPSNITSPNCILPHQITSIRSYQKSEHLLNSKVHNARCSFCKFIFKQNQWMNIVAHGTISSNTTTNNNKKTDNNSSILEKEKVCALKQTLQAFIWNDMCYGTHQICIQYKRTHCTSCEHMYTSKFLRLTVIKCICKRCFGCRFDSAHVHNQFSSFTLYFCTYVSILNSAIMLLLLLLLLCKNGSCVFDGNISRWKLKTNGTKKRNRGKNDLSSSNKVWVHSHWLLFFFSFDKRDKD